jgi:hypothetical protein
VDLHTGQGGTDEGSYVLLAGGTTVKAALVTGRGGAGGIGKSDSKTLSEAYGSGVPSSSYLIQRESCQ